MSQPEIDCDASEVAAFDAAARRSGNAAGVHATDTTPTSVSAAACSWS
jgi:hypothetical protein